VERARGKGSRRSSLFRYRANLIVRVVLEEKYVAVPNESTRMRMGIATREKRAVEREWAGCVYCAAGGERK
tara:strand:+ start:237 stop:449 length:213 start_codon:yes stop_codon:yes gene_type:complete